MTNTTLNNHNDVLEALAEEIEVPDHLDKLARCRYQAIGDWLNREESSITHRDPKISPQGSFILGTAIRPLQDDDTFDIDLVVTLQGTKQQLTMKELKDMVGNEVIAYANARNMKQKPEDKRRCWTMEYSDSVNFHLDILPSIPDIDRYKALLENHNRDGLSASSDIADLAIAITDKELPEFSVLTNDWPISNPKGFANWFNLQQATVLEEYRQRMVNNKQYASVEEVPAYHAKTPLQRAIQLLKRHRDKMFEGNEDKPISIIITTLAAHAYNGERNIQQALRTILRNMGNHITNLNGKHEVQNPVCPWENFADKWVEDPQKQENFFEWLRRAQEDFGVYFNQPYDQIPKPLQTMTGVKAVRDIASRFNQRVAPSTKAAIALETTAVQHSGKTTKPWVG